MDQRSLMDRRQESVAHHGDSAVRDAAAASDHEARQVPILAAQPVGDPRPHARKSRERQAAVDVVVALGVLHELGGHGADHAQFIGDLAYAREQVADRDPALAARLERPRAREDRAVLVEHGPLGLERHRLTGLLREARLGIERVDMRHAARHVAEDDVSDLGLEMRALRPQLLSGIRSFPSGSRFLRHQRGGSQHAETGRRGAKHRPPTEALRQARRQVSGHRGTP